MGLHPDLPRDPILMWVDYNISDYSRALDYVEYKVVLSCSSCGTVKWYHIGCRGCNTHALDICVTNKRIEHYCYFDSHSVHINIYKLKVEEINIP